MVKYFSNREIDHLYNCFVSFIRKEESQLAYIVSNLNDNDFDVLYDYEDTKFNGQTILTLDDETGTFDYFKFLGRWCTTRPFKQDQYHLILKNEKDIFKYLGYHIYFKAETIKGSSYTAPLLDFEFDITGRIRPYNTMDNTTLSGFITVAQAKQLMNNKLNVD